MTRQSDSLGAHDLPVARASTDAIGSAVVALGIVEAEEVALGTVGLVFLINEVEVALIECSEPLVPLDVTQPSALRVATEIEPQDAKVAVVFRSLDCRRYGVTALSP